MSDNKDLHQDPLWVCYCDFDGVTHDDAVLFPARWHTHAYSRQNPIRVVTDSRRIACPYPDLKIVLSTSCVRVKGFEFAKRQLTPGLQSRVIGATFHKRETQKFDFDNMSRGMQICADVRRRKPTRWFAIDNDDHAWPAWCRDHLIKTEDRLGLSDLGVQYAIRKVLASY